MRVAEIYPSIQGEGRLTGVASLFVRASGCNLRCVYCDSPFTSWRPEGADWSVEEIVAAISKFDCSHVVLTGGEPMLFAELIPLCAQLRALNKHITIETAGTLYLPLECDLMSISPKMTNSTPPADQYPRWHHRHEQTRRAPSVIRRLLGQYDCQLKFVIARPSDVAEVTTFVKEFPELTPDQVQLMPEGTTVEQLNAVGAWLQPRCAELQYQFCPRRHIEWFGFARGT